MTPVDAYQEFSREEWAALRASTLMPLAAADLPDLTGLGDVLSLAEIEDVYLPLCRLIGLAAVASRAQRAVAGDFLGREFAPAPFVVGIAGSVSVGKSTTARVIQAVLAALPSVRSVDLVTTDGFLYPNAELDRRGIMHRKGFPESYDRRALVDFLAAVRSGDPAVVAPVYSHLVYDILPDSVQVVSAPDMLIVEGLNLLQNPSGEAVLVSDFLDFSIYVDADEKDIRRWFTERFLALRRTAFADPTSFFHRFAALSDEQAVARAEEVWDTINGPNLEANILPTRDRARLVLHKGADHRVGRVRLRQI